MSQRPDDANPFDPFGTMRSMRDATLDAWSKAMQQMVNSEEYSKATATMLDAYLTTSAPFRQALEQTMTQVLQAYNMPSRTDVTAIAERMTNIEMRLDDLDAQLSAFRRSMRQTQPAPERNGDVPPAPVPAPEAPAAAQDPVVETLSETESGADAGQPSASRRKGRAKEGQ